MPPALLNLEFKDINWVGGSVCVCEQKWEGLLAYFEVLY